MPAPASYSRPWMYFVFTSVMPAAAVALIGFMLMFAGDILPSVGSTAFQHHASRLPYGWG